MTTAYIVEAGREWITWMWLCRKCMEARVKRGWTCKVIRECSHCCDDCETEAQAKGIVREWSPVLGGQLPNQASPPVAQDNPTVGDVRVPALQSVPKAIGPNTGKKAKGRGDTAQLPGMGEKP